MTVTNTSFRGMWDGTAASIPTGWSRDTAFDGKYLEGGTTGYTAPSNGGNASHIHTQNAHTHTETGHTHLITNSGESSTLITARVYGFGVKISATEKAHNHAGVTSTSGTATYSNATITSFLQASDASFAKMIVLQPDSGGVDIPPSMIVFGLEELTGYTKQTGYDDRMVLGADASGDGGATGGNATHTHPQSGSGHQHTRSDSHTHSGNIGNSDTTFPFAQDGFTSGILPPDHHTITLNAEAGSCELDATASSAASNFGPYIKLFALKADSGADKATNQTIMAYVGTEAGIPAPWQLCDGTNGTPDCRNRYVYITSTAGELEDTDVDDGITTVDSHTHTYTHTHSDTHVHSSITDSLASAVNYTTGGTTKNAPSQTDHTHTWANAAAAITTSETAATMSTEDGRSAFRLVLWVMDTTATGGIGPIEPYHRRMRQ